MDSVLDELRARGFIKEIAHEELLRERLNQKGLKFYVGFDPTADCFHIGNLIPIMCMAWLQKAGHSPIVVLGGGTAMVGDPSGKDKTREILSKEKVEYNLNKQRPLFARFLNLDQTLMLNNADWLLSLNYISFLRDIGRHFSVNTMIKAEGAKQRLERGQGYSFIEFNYHLLQCYDFLHLYKEHDCVLQIGGDDQWFHLCGGMELIRKELGGEGFGFTIPLLETSDGKKMGKTEKGAVWISAEKTSSFEYYQFWINVQDADVIKLMKLYTFMPLSEIEGYAQLQGADLRKAKRKLAYEATKLVHGEEEAIKAEQTALELFSGKVSADMPTLNVQFPIPVLTALVESGLCKSRSEARKKINGRGVKIDWGKGKEAIEDQHLEIEGEGILWLGKKRCVRLSSKS
ncbi:MAG: tyrosine--tRNA ligase [Proteobacteria bacterium]|nr:tyrosine--tRNA ligase [Pseudomonadota bacterium]